MTDELSEFEWAREQTCNTLNSMTDVTFAKLCAASLKLPLHHDKWKNWDSYLAIHHVQRLVNESVPVMDAGACRDPGSPSVFLPSLEKLGYTDLHGCNLDETTSARIGNVMYSHQNIEKTNYPSNYFAFIACLSTIEHGVDERKYFAEMARVLRPGGYLFTSFDYWHTNVDAKGIQAFGAPVRIFTEDDVMKMSLYATTECGLHLMKRPQLRGTAKLVKWMGMEYTFLNLLMRKDPD